MGEKKVRFTSVKGVTFENSDGTKRQSILEKLMPNDELELLRETNNPFDKNAIQVRTKSGQMLGFLSKELAADLAPNIDKGIIVKCFVKEVTGGTKDAPTRGLNIMLEAEV